MKRNVLLGAAVIAAVSLLVIAFSTVAPYVSAAQCSNQLSLDATKLSTFKLEAHPSGTPWGATIGSDGNTIEQAVKPGAKANVTVSAGQWMTLVAYRSDTGPILLGTAQIINCNATGDLPVAPVEVNGMPVSDIPQYDGWTVLNTKKQGNDWVVYQHVVPSK